MEGFCCSLLLSSLQLCEPCKHFPLNTFQLPPPRTSPTPCPPPRLHSSILHCVSCTAHTNCTMHGCGGGKEGGKEESKERTSEESVRVKTGGSSAHGRDGRCKIGSRRKRREEQIQVRVQSDQRQPQGRSMLALAILQGARKHLEAAEMEAQEIQSLLSTAPRWCKIRRVGLGEPSLPPLLTKGYSACGRGCFVSCSFFHTPWPLTLLQLLV